MNGTDHAATNTKTGAAAKSTQIPDSGKSVATATATRKYSRSTPVKPNISPQTGFRTDLPGQR